MHHIPYSDNGFSITLHGVKESLDDLLKKFPYSLGKNRFVLFVNEKYVVKIPRKEYNVYSFNDPTCGVLYGYDIDHEANLKEANIYQKYAERLAAGSDEKIHYACCKMIKFRGRAALLMERVVLDFGFGFDCEKYPLPDWAFEIDAHQVGELANGKLVAYDYAD